MLGEERRAAEHDEDEADRVEVRVEQLLHGPREHVLRERAVHRHGERTEAEVQAGGEAGQQQGSRGTRHLLAGGVDLLLEDGVIALLRLLERVVATQRLVRLVRRSDLTSLLPFPVCS